MGPQSWLLVNRCTQCCEAVEHALSMRMLARHRLVPYGCAVVIPVPGRNRRSLSESGWPAHLQREPPQVAVGAALVVLCLVAEEVVAVVAAPSSEQEDSLERTGVPYVSALRSGRMQAEGAAEVLVVSAIGTHCIAHAASLPEELSVSDESCMLVARCCLRLVAALLASPTIVSLPQSDNLA